MWIPGIELTLLCLAASSLTHRAILLVPSTLFYRSQKHQPKDLLPYLLLDDKAETGIAVCQWGPSLSKHPTQWEQTCLFLELQTRLQIAPLRLASLVAKSHIVKLHQSTVAKSKIHSMLKICYRNEGRLIGRSILYPAFKLMPWTPWVPLSGHRG